jgi:hypothetical protein
MTDRELMQMALDALEKIEMGGDPRWASDVTPALHARLAQPEPEPVAWMSQGGDVSRSRRYFEEMGFVDLIPLYTAPPQREWQGLTDEEREEATGWSVEHIEAKLKAKNHD